MTRSEVRTSILEDRSKANIAFLVKVMAADDSLVESCMDFVDDPDPKLAMRYMWLLGHLAEVRPKLLFGYMSHLFAKRHMHNTITGLHRSLVKMLTFTGVPEDIQGLVVDQIFEWCLDPEIQVAVKVYGITVLVDLCKIYPELETELKAVIHDQMDKNTYAFTARSKQILKQLEKK